MMEMKDYPQNICSTCRQVLRPETDVAVAATECVGINMTGLKRRDKLPFAFLLKVTFVYPHSMGSSS